MSRQFPIRLFGLLILTVLLGSRSVFCQIPETISFQGELGNSVPANSTQTLTLRLYADSSGGGAIWAETHTVVLDRRAFSLTLGSRVPLHLPFDRQYWLGLAVGSSPELSPRVRFAAVPYSLNAAAVDGMRITRPNSALADGALLRWSAGDQAWQPTAPIAGGDLSGTYPAPTVNRLQGRTVSTMPPSDGNALLWRADSGEWVPSVLPGFTLPFVGASSSEDDAFAIVHDSSMGTVAHFTSLYRYNEFPVLQVEQFGRGAAIEANGRGDGEAALFRASGLRPTLSVWAHGNGSAGEFHVNNGTSGADALVAETAGTGNAIRAIGNVVAEGDLEVSGDIAATNVDAVHVATSGGLTIGNGTPVLKVVSRTDWLDFPPVPPHRSMDRRVRLDGARVGDPVWLGTAPPSVEDGTAFTAWISEAGYVTVRCNNYGDDYVNPRPGEFTVSAIQF